MEDDDEIQSHPSPASNGRITVTVAAAPPVTTHNTLTLALPIQQQKVGGTGGGREDCWSEGATAVLIDAWGERYLELSRGNLKQKHWKDVADIVSSREDYMKTPKTDIQCKNRIDTVKKKYKTEKAKIVAGGGPSKWRFYEKMDELIGPTAKMNSGSGGGAAGNANVASGSQRVPMGIPVGTRSGSVSQFRHQERFQVQQQPKPQFRKRPPVDSDEESEAEAEASGDSSDGLPPESYKRPRVEKEMMMVNAPGMMNRKMDEQTVETNWGNSVSELTRAILKLGESYEQAENSKMQQVVEMEKQRMKFMKEMELQRMQFFMKTQLELSQLKDKRNVHPYQPSFVQETIVEIHCSSPSAEATVFTSKNQIPDEPVTTMPIKKRRNLLGMPDPYAELISLSPRTCWKPTDLSFVYEICNKRFKRDHNLQLHRRGQIDFKS